jgi:cytochrome P450
MTRFVFKYPSPFQIWLGPKLFVVTDNPEDAKILLNSPNSSSKADVYRFMESTFNVGVGGLISLNGDIWKHHRKLLNGCFKPDILKTYVSIFNKCARNMSNNVLNHVGQKEMFNIEKNIHACSLDMIVGKKIY